MDNRTAIFALAVMAILVISLVIGLIGIIRSERESHKEEIQARDAELERYKKSQNTAQRATIKGHLAEQMYPLLTESCPYTLSDMRFMGMPVDYIIFDGYTDCKDGDGHIREIIFADIKSGQAQLSKTQRSIRDAISAGRVRWETINL